jgi:hypothetical protein
VVLDAIWPRLLKSGSNGGLQKKSGWLFAVDWFIPSKSCAWLAKPPAVCSDGTEQTLLSTEFNVMLLSL